MAGVVPSTNQEAMMKILQQVASAMAAPDANLEQLADLQKLVVASIRQPYDTASPGSPVGASMDIGAGAVAPEGAAPGQLSPMLAALMGGAGGPAPGVGAATAGPSPMAPGVMAKAAPPNMDEVRRMIQAPGGRTV